jgi:HAD superfamily hydrolase (TIGR01549 family)
MAISTVIFDFGETLLCEDRMWARWAAYLGVPAATFRSALDDVIKRGEHHRKAFEHFRPGFDMQAALRERAANGDIYLYEAVDLYPDARPCLAALRARAYRIGIAGNQPIEAEQRIRDLDLGADFIVTSAGLGIEKPSPGFFARIAEIAGAPPAAIAYVGDRLDNDVLPARAAGMVSVFLERGPWGERHAKRADARLADIWLKDLAALPEALAGWSAVGVR